MQVSKVDVNSLANLEETTTNHVHLDLTVDFNTSSISGNALISGHVLKDNTDVVVFDTNHLNIKRVWLKRDTEFVQVESKVSDPHTVFGSALSVPLTSAQLGDQFTIRIEYTTMEAGCAIQFLDPEQTLGKEHPYLFTQCQPIHARSLFPCQDSPSVKISYSASIRVPKPLTALMSAISTGSVDDGDFTVFSFEQKTTIP
ncbi:Leucyl aminopeptidase yscIV, partial [Coemansia sp. RSA 2399]